MTGRSARRPDDGYVLLALLLSTSILLAVLALAVPRMAMQSQRIKDGRLIERGEQYKRAIKLYYRAHGRYPEEISDLEETDGVRYLRRRYTDPTTDSGEWRLIHMGTDGRFEDSLHFDLAKDGRLRDGGAGGAAAFSLSGGGPALPGPSQPLPQQPAGQALPGQQPADPRNRASVARRSAAPDLIGSQPYNRGFEFDPNEAAGTEADEPVDPSRMLPSELPMIENDFGGDDPFARFRGRRDPRNPPATPFATNDPARPGGSDASRRPAGSGSPAGEGDPASLVAGSGAAATISRLLTTPRTAGAAGPARAAVQAAATQVFERGIAGVASQSEAAGVRVYDGRERYNEWEFVYDYRKDDDGRPDEVGAQRPSEAELQRERARRTQPGGALR